MITIRIRKVISTGQRDEENNITRRWKYKEKRADDYNKKKQINKYNDKMIGKRIGEVVSMRRGDYWNKDRRIDIDEEKRKGEEHHKEVKIIG